MSRLAHLLTEPPGSRRRNSNVTDVLVRDGAGNTIADNLQSFDENEAEAVCLSATQHTRQAPCRESLWLRRSVQGPRSSGVL